MSLSRAGPVLTVWAGRLGPAWGHPSEETRRLNRQRRGRRMIEIDLPPIGVRWGRGTLATLVESRGTPSG